MSELPTYVIKRTFNAPRWLVWRAWTDPELVQRWYGPGVESVIHGFDLKPGGAWLNEMIFGENSNYQKMVFVDVEAPEKLVWHHFSSTDAEWNNSPNPMMPDWPQMLLTTVLFEDAGEQTLVTLSQVPMDATQAEIDCFAGVMANMDKGWGSGYAVIDEILAELAG